MDDYFPVEKWIIIKTLYENQFWKTSKEDGKRLFYLTKRRKVQLIVF